MFKLTLFIAICLIASASASEVFSYGGPEGRIIRAHYTVRPTNVVCKKAPCPAFTLSKVNVATAPETSITKFIFANPSTEPAFIAAPTSELVVSGIFVADIYPGHYRFLVLSFYRVLPFTGIASVPTGRFYRLKDSGIRCITTPCPSQALVELNTGIETLIFGYTSPYSVIPMFDGNWLHAELFDVAPYGAIVQANIGADNYANTERVFVNLPDPTTPCPAIVPSVCNNAIGQVNIFQRDEKRCISASGCTQGGACILSIPSCEPGYRLVSFPSGIFGCPSYVCDAEFLDETPSP
eukprot:gene17480-20856_t